MADRPRLHDENERLRAEMAFITELSTVVAANSELQPILDWVVSKTTQLLGADECSIRLMSADQSTTKTVVVMDKGGAEAGTSSWPLPLKNSVMGFLMVRPGELASPDIAADARFPGLKNLSLPVRALLAVPLMVDGRVTGMLAVSHTFPPFVHVKLALLVVYIGLGVMAFRKAKTAGQKAGFLLAAVAVFLFMVSVAVTKSPLGIFA